ncbi:MAG: hypothetical protein K8F91_11690 [Candidatus Obscuribacterales bacterium]|nr:hypothetical protein [Candidatus Obscuribacterales bacterium]
MTNTTFSPAFTKPGSQPWLCSAAFDGALIIAPALIASTFVILLRPQLEGSASLPLWAWVCFVLMVDVAHVYATLFRTYLDREAMSKNRNLLLSIPLACWIVGCLLYSVNGLLFWQALAYLAVFHFIRQQYGFMALYAFRDPEKARRFAWLDGALLYMATLYPLAYWHTHLPRNFNWFIEGDFLPVLPPMVTTIALILYIVLIGGYAVKETLVSLQTKFFNIPKNLIIFATASSWWAGIVLLNSDMAFTMTNVVSHGIPYMALIWLYHRQTATVTSKNQEGKNQEGKSIIDLILKITLSYLPAFLFFLIMLAYLEEGLWDGLVWREHLGFFSLFSSLPEITDKAWLAILVPLLCLPQSTHYILDGFIWKVKDRKRIWSA